MVYKEVGTLNVGRRETLQLENENTPETGFIAPDTDKVKTIHIVLQVTDNGSPNLTRYQRVIVNVMPKVE